MEIKKAVFPVGGWGIRFLPATKAISKEMFPIIDKPIIQYGVEEAVHSGIEQVIFVTTERKRALEEHFSTSLDLESFLENNCKKDMLQIVREISNIAYFRFIHDKFNGQKRGLGMGVLSAKEIVGDEAFAVFLTEDLIDAKIPCMKCIIEIYKALKCPVFAVKKVPIEEIFNYGNIEFCKLDTETFQKLKGRVYKPERVYEVKRLIEKPNPKKKEHLSNLGIIGRYVLPPEIFEILEKTPPGKDGEVQLTDAIELLRKNGQKIYAYEFEGAVYDTGSKLGYLKACVDFALKRPELAKEFKIYLQRLSIRNQ